MEPVTMISAGLGIIKGLKSILPFFGEKSKKVAEAIDTIDEAVGEVRGGNMPPETRLELEKALIGREISLAEIEAGLIETINATMLGEAKSEHFLQYAWWPFWGFCGGLTFFCSYFVLPLIGKAVPAIPYEAWGVMAAILGVASWGRNRLKEKKAGGK